MTRKKTHAARSDAAALLDSIAAALNAAQRAGMDVRLKHGAVFTVAGYVLPLANDQWCARTLAYTEFPAERTGDELEDE